MRLWGCAGKAYFGAFAHLTENEVMIGLKDKLVGQINLVLIGRDYVNDEGSFTLTSGVVGAPARPGVGGPRPPRRP